MDAQIEATITESQYPPNDKSVILFRFLPKDDTN
jgi:hypothetical protein